MMDLHEIVVDLHNARTLLDGLKDEYNAARAAFEAEHQELDAKIKAAMGQVNDLEEAARTATLTAYKADPDNGKKPHPALGIREGTRLVYEEASALSWAITHDIRAALKLDRSAFEKLAKAGGVDTIEVGLTSETTHTATIAADLSKFVES